MPRCGLLDTRTRGDLKFIVDDFLVRCAGATPGVWAQHRRVRVAVHWKRLPVACPLLKVLVDHCSLEQRRAERQGGSDGARIELRRFDAGRSGSA